MRQLIFLLSVFITGCGGCNYSQPYPVVAPVAGPQYEYMQSPMGGDPYVRIYDGALSYMVAASVFNSLGYSGCVNYYHVHPNCYPRYNSSVYGSWRNTGRVVPLYRPSPGYSRPVAPAYNRPVYRPSYTPSRSYTPSYRPSSSSSRPSYRRH